MKLYNVRTFTKDIKKAFDLALEETEVFILRDNIVFKVSKANNQDKSKFTEAGIISKNPRPQGANVI